VAPSFAAHPQAPNPSIERTFQRPLRALWPAAHVERWAPEARSVLRVAPSSAQAAVRFSKVVNTGLLWSTHHAVARAGCPSVGGQLTVVGGRKTQAKAFLASCGARRTTRGRNGSSLPGSSSERAVRPSAASGRSYQLQRRKKPACSAGCYSGWRSSRHVRRFVPSASSRELAARAFVGTIVLFTQSCQARHCGPTLPSSGRAKACFAAFSPPLMSNVRPHKTLISFTP
jgi:hypothetical protein